MAGVRGRSDGLNTILIFVRVGQSRTFTEAGKKLGLSASGVSRSILRLEERLGIRLVNRTTRTVNLTPEGRLYFERCQQILEELEEAEAALTKARDEPRGQLRIQIPRGFGRKVMIPLIAEFLGRYPEVTVDIAVNDGAMEVAEKGIDVALRLEEPSDGRFVARKLCTIGYAACAAPSYLERHGEPLDPSELANHRCLNYVLPRSGRHREWVFDKDGGRVSMPIAAILNTNDIHTILEAAISGAGIAYLMDFLIADAVRAGALRILMAEYAHDNVPVYITYMPNRFQSSRVRTFVEFLTAALRPPPAWRLARLLSESRATPRVRRL